MKGDRGSGSLYIGQRISLRGENGRLCSRFAFSVIQLVLVTESGGVLLGRISS